MIDQPALLTALRERAVAGADVFAPEPLPPDHSLLGLGNVIATPHTAFYSEASVATLVLLAAELVAAVLGGRRPRRSSTPKSTFDLRADVVPATS